MYVCAYRCRAAVVVLVCSPAHLYSWWWLSHVWRHERTYSACIRISTIYLSPWHEFKHGNIPLSRGQKKRERLWPNITFTSFLPKNSFILSSSPFSIWIHLSFHFFSFFPSKVTVVFICHGLIDTAVNLNWEKIGKRLSLLIYETSLAVDTKGKSSVKGNRLTYIYIYIRAM